MAARVSFPLNLFAATVLAPDARAKGTSWAISTKAPINSLTRQAFQLLRIVNVGAYAIQPIWADGHATGIFSFDYLRRLSD